MSAQPQDEMLESVLPGPAPEELVMHLERDQLAAATLLPVPRAHLSARVRAALWALRVFAVVVSAMVIYTFLAGLH